MNSKRIRQLAAALLAGVALAAWAQTSFAKEDPKTRLAKAEAMFAERCKKAGVFIHRTAENVEGIFLMKLRPKEINYGDQYRLDDPYGRDIGGDGFIMTFLQGYETRQAEFAAGAPRRYGYSYVAAIDEKDGKRYRYTGSMKVVGRKNPNTPNHKIELARNPNFDLNNYAFVLDKVPATDTSPRYGVTYDDISTREERDYWIAGSSLKVIDLKTNEVMAERIGYMMDRGQGNNSGGRAPWLLAADTACPDFWRNTKLARPRPMNGASLQAHQTEDFVESILKPALEK